MRIEETNFKSKSRNMNTLVHLFNKIAKSSTDLESTLRKSMKKILYNDVGVVLYE